MNIPAVFSICFPFFIFWRFCLNALLVLLATSLPCIHPFIQWSSFRPNARMLEGWNTIPLYLRFIHLANNISAPLIYGIMCGAARTSEDDFLPFPLSSFRILSLAALFCAIFLPKPPPPPPLPVSLSLSLAVLCEALKSCRAFPTSTDVACSTAPAIRQRYNW